MQARTVSVTQIQFRLRRVVTNSELGLYNAFLAPGSPCELNIDHSLRNALASRMTRAVGDDKSMVASLKEVASLFQRAQSSVFKLMASVSSSLHISIGFNINVKANTSQDSVPKFVRDPKYATTLRERNFDHVLSSTLANTSIS